jgi:hypothetical protein
MPAVVTLPLDNTSTVRDVVSSLPLICHGYYLPILNSLNEKAQRYFSALHAEQEFISMKNQGKTPNSINSVKTPTLQVSSEFKQHKGNKEYESIETYTSEVRKTFLDKFAKAKAEEASFYYKTYLSVDKQTEAVNEANKKIADGLMTTHNVKTITELPQHVQDALANVMNGGGVGLAQHTIEIARLRSLSAYEKTKSKKTIKAAADVEMSGTGGTVNEKTLEKSVEQVLKRKEQSRRDKQRNGKGNILFSSLSSKELLTNLDLQRQKLHEEEEKRPRRIHFKRKIIEETSQILECAPKRLKVARVGDYPREFFSATLESRVLFLRMKCRRSILQTLRVMNFGVHTHEDVTLPKNIEYFLSVNLKYIFPQKMNLSLPLQSYNMTAMKLRQWYKYRAVTRKNELPEYLSRLDRQVPDLPFSADFLESGLKAGRDLLTSVTNAVVPYQSRRAEPEPFLSELGCSVKSLKEFMLLKQYMAFITDKNLGIAVVRSDWYSDKVCEHLKLSVYEEVPHPEWEWMAWSINLLAKHEGISKDIRSFVNQSPRVTDLPSFHGIPKIHKNPWKIRPIVPMHSYATTRIAMVVHYYLQPLMEQYPWICQSSRSFVRDLLRETKGVAKCWRLWTADVQSMYTNIKTEELLLALREAMDPIIDPHLGDWIIGAVQFLNTSVFFQFGQQIYKQKYGIAMGLACAPTLANLFMAVWEAKANVSERFLFYRRYIDDIFALTQGEDLSSLVSPPGLILDWESSDSIPFLDCEVHLHGQEICVKPYTKALAHYQYIPWNSGHPIHVKRGLVKTELIRFSSLSAKQEYFDERKKKLHILLRARGYPETALKAWMRQVQWRNPSEALPGGGSRTATGQLFVPSEYNPVWEHVTLGPVWEAFSDELVRWRKPVYPPYQKMTQSLQRTKNFWDLVRRSNREIVEGNEQEASIALNRMSAYLCGPLPIRLSNSD